MSKGGRGCVCVCVTEGRSEKRMGGEGKGK